MSRTAWALSAIEELNAQGSWTGRVHIHKLLYLAQELRLHGQVPFVFDLYRFGPYSFDLDEHLRELASGGLVQTSLVSEGYGPKHEVAKVVRDPGLKLDLLLSEPLSVELKRVASAVKDRPSSELELIATCLWVERKESLTDRDAVISRVRQIKPKYPVEQIGYQFDQLQLLKSMLAA